MDLSPAKSLFKSRVYQILYVKNQTQLYSVYRNLNYKDRNNLKLKGQKNVYHVKTNQRKGRVAILVQQSRLHHKEYYQGQRETFHSDERILSWRCNNPKYICLITGLQNTLSKNQKELKDGMDKSIIVVIDFNTSLLRGVDRISRQIITTYIKRYE